MNSEDLAATLKKMNACEQGLDWVEGKDLVTAWTTCHRSDWLLWLLDKAAMLDPITNELLVCRFAREVHHLNPDPRVLACIETREAWARGEVWDEVRDAARDAAWDAAMAADWGAAYAASADTAYAAAWGAAGDPAAWTAAEARQADIIRELVPMPTREIILASV